MQRLLQTTLRGHLGRQRRIRIEARHVGGGGLAPRDLPHPRDDGLGLLLAAPLLHGFAPREVLRARDLAQDGELIGGFHGRQS